MSFFYILNSCFRNKQLLTLVLLFGCLSFEAVAQGDLLITPNRVVFEGKKKNESLNLINTGKEITTYTVSFVQRRMNEDGSFTGIETPDEGQLFADPYLRIYPRKITLAPGEGQVIKVQFIRKPEMLEGEYRSHLYFRSENDYTPLGTKKVDTTKILSVQLTPIFGISIPIIIRIGNVSSSANFSDLRLEKQQEPVLSFVLNRTGNGSLYGNLEVELIPKQGKPYQIGAVNGVAVYTTINKRNVSIKLTATLEELKNGKLRLRYISRKDASKQEVYAEVALPM